MRLLIVLTCLLYCQGLMALDECQVYSMVLDTIAARMGNFVTSPTGSVQPYKYTGKELDRENGLDTYDFEARCYPNSRPTLGAPPTPSSMWTPQG